MVTITVIIPFIFKNEGRIDIMKFALTDAKDTDITVKIIPIKCGSDKVCFVNLTRVDKNLNFRDIDVLCKEFEAGDISLDSFVKALRGEE
jgi:hypothetical protein